MPSSAVRELLKCWLPGGDEISGKACCELCACQEAGWVGGWMGGDHHEDAGERQIKYVVFLTFAI